MAIGSRMILSSNANSYNPPLGITWILDASNSYGISVVDQTKIIKTWNSVDSNKNIVFISSANYLIANNPIFIDVDSNGNSFARVTKDGVPPNMTATTPSFWNKTLYISIRYTGTSPNTGWNTVFLHNDENNNGSLSDGSFALQPYFRNSVLFALFSKSLSTKNVDTEDTTTQDLSDFTKINIIMLYISLDTIDVYLNNVRLTDLPMTNLSRTSNNPICSGIGTCLTTFFQSLSGYFDLYEIREYDTYHNETEVGNINTEIRAKLGTYVIP